MNTKMGYSYVYHNPKTEKQVKACIPCKLVFLRPDEQRLRKCPECKSKLKTVWVDKNSRKRVNINPDYIKGDGTEE